MTTTELSRAEILAELKELELRKLELQQLLPSTVKSFYLFRCKPETHVWIYAASREQAEERLHIHELVSPDSGACSLTGTCKQSGGVSRYVIEPWNEGCNWCGEGDLVGGKITISWSCWYPRIAHVVADYTNADCDNCDELNDLDLLYDCDNTSFPDLAWKAIIDGPEGCSTEVSIRYYCDLKSLVYFDPDASFIKTDDNVSLSDILNGGPIVLDLQVSPGSSRCNDPTSITVTFSDNGKWCP